jgi:hypothetical protein
MGMDFFCWSMSLILWGSGSRLARTVSPVVGGGVSNEVDDGLAGLSRSSAPVAGYPREKSVLVFVQFAGTVRVVEQSSRSRVFPGARLEPSFFDGGHSEDRGVVHAVGDGFGLVSTLITGSPVAREDSVRELR